MTFSQLVISDLTSKGMFPSEADSVLESIKADPANKAMAERWDEDPCGYHPSMPIVILLKANRAARQYLAANKPMAWYRSMFEEVRL